MAENRSAGEFLFTPIPAGGAAFGPPPRVWGTRSTDFQ